MKLIELIADYQHAESHREDGAVLAADWDAGKGETEIWIFFYHRRGLYFNSSLLEEELPRRDATGTMIDYAAADLERRAAALDFTDWQVT